MHGTKSSKKVFSVIGQKKKKERPNFVDDEMLQKIRDVVIGSHLAETVVSQKLVIAIGTGAIKANEPTILKEFGGSLELCEAWARVWEKRKGTTEKIEPGAKFLEEEEF